MHHTSVSGVAASSVIHRLRVISASCGAGFSETSIEQQACSSSSTKAVVLLTAVDLCLHGCLHFELCDGANMKWLQYLLHIGRHFSSTVGGAHWSRSSYNASTMVATGGIGMCE